MTRPISAVDALLRAVKAQQVQRDAIKDAAREIAEKRDEEAARESKSENS